MEVLTKFQSTPLREGRPGRVRFHAGGRGFNPRPSVRGDAVPPSPWARANGFNPRPSVRGDAHAFYHIKGKNGFNPRPSVRGDRGATALQR